MTVQVNSSDNEPSGVISQAADLFIEGGPDFWFGGVQKYAPDDDGFYWGLTGVAGNPARRIGCYTDFRFRDNLQITDVRCDTQGVVSSIQKRNYLEASFTLMSLLPLAQLRYMLRGSAVTENDAEGTEKMGLGEIEQNVVFPVYFSKVYDLENGDFVSVTGHRCQFVDAWELAANYGAPWTLGVRLRMYADSDKPAAQRFATVLRYDPSLL